MTIRELWDYANKNGITDIDVELKIRVQEVESTKTLTSDMFHIERAERPSLKNLFCKTSKPCKLILHT